jgi:hypothetical protein
MASVDAASSARLSGPSRAPAGDPRTLPPGRHQLVRSGTGYGATRGRTGKARYFGRASKTALATGTAENEFGHPA